MSSSAPRPFTGRHMTTILVAFFAVVIAVNVLMARLANFAGKLKRDKQPLKSETPSHDKPGKD